LTRRPASRETRGQDIELSTLNAESVEFRLSLKRKEIEFWQTSRKQQQKIENREQKEDIQFLICGFVSPSLN